MNIFLRKIAKNDFEKNFFKLMNNAVFGGSMEDVRKLADIKFIETWKRRNYSNLEPNDHSAKLFTENILATEMNINE